MRRIVLLVIAAVAALTVSGASGSAGSVQARWVIRDLGTLGDWMIDDATGINERGQVVGFSHTAAGSPHAFLWWKGKMRDLGTLGGGASFAESISTRGQVVGKAGTGKSFHAFLWQNGKMRDLGVLGGTSSGAFAINEQGQVVGFLVGDRENKRHAFFWEQGAMTDLGTLGGISSEAAALNNLGQVVGSSRTGEMAANRAGSYL